MRDRRILNTAGARPLSAVRSAKVLKERSRLERLMRNSNSAPKAPTAQINLFPVINKNPRIFDCFTFFNELELLELRLMELDNAVHKFVIVEANKSHTGHPKPFIFEENKHRFEKWLHKIIYVKVEDLPSFDAKNQGSSVDWRPENFQRNAIMRGINGTAVDGDKIFISDLDEIWDKRAIPHVIMIMSPVVFMQAMFYYFVNTRFPESWFGTVMATYGQFDTPQTLRNTRVQLSNIVKQGGWHYSYQGGIKGVFSKISNIAEASLIEDRLGTVEKINYKLTTLEDPLNRPQKISIDWNYIPETLDKFISKYPSFVYESKLSTEHAEFPAHSLGKFAQLVLSTCHPKKVEWLNLALENLDSSPNLKFSRKILTLDEFNEWRFPHSLIEKFACFNWKTIKNRGKSKIKSMTHGLENIKEDIVFYNEGDVFVDFPKEVNIEQCFDLKDKDNRMCGMISLTIGGTRGWWSSDPNSSVGDLINAGKNTILKFDKYFCFLREEEHKDDKFFELPTLFIRKDLLEKCLGHALQHHIGKQIEQALTASWFDLGLNKEFFKCSIARNNLSEVANNYPREIFRQCLLVHTLDQQQIRFDYGNFELI